MKPFEVKPFTDGKKPVSRYTLVVDFKPEFQRVNPEGGEVYTQWTYRSDIEVAKLCRKKIEVEFAIDALGYVFCKYHYRYTEAVFYDNTLPDPVLATVVNGKIVYPPPGAKRERFKTWLKKCAKP